LPQLWNVVKGELSLVGPRPEVEKYISFYKDDYKEILKIRPGITDYAAIKFRNEEEILSSSLKM
jgi:lipopolysaccharide/colanic/teichoic acid biosynthesis glycosyltransferase